ncbi:iron(III) transport system permease protein [Pseudonocardia hierapolitana]|uniref:Iron(III) transport system permease protein n=1 Tax=Pseudonocardia hierapolitana TaxID=1128676 RepID=A0A561T4R8_9PSEU|nr:iron ABC transporter permease [Pseudonocardia hierapolitana]TWF82120.1 iron(III) transport system permease protein [Pseudonocardia hierapolitana]
MATVTTPPRSGTPSPAGTSAGGGRASIARWRDTLLRPRTLVAVAVTVVVGYLALVPLGYLLLTTFTDADGFSLGGFARAYGDPRIGELIGNSLWFAVGSALLSLAVGTALAYFNVRTDVPFKALFFAASIIPLIIPGILYTIAWIFLASPTIGLLNSLLEPVFGPGTFDVFTVWGMIWVEGLHLSPIAFLFMVAAFRSTDPSLEESALMSGATRVQTFRRVTLPLVRPALLSAALIMLVRSLESFEVPALLGLQNGIYVFTSRIYQVLRSFPVDFAGAGALAVGLLAVAALGIWLSNVLSRDHGGGTITGKGFRPRPIDLGRWKPAVGGGILLYFFVTVLAPLLVLLYTALLPYYRPPSAEAFASMSLDNFVAVFNLPTVPTALRNSLLLGGGAATIVMALMAVAAWVVVRSGIPGRQVLDHIAFSPLVIPGLVLGVGIAFVYLRSPLPIYGTLLILLIAYCTRYLPYGMRYAVSGMQTVSAELEESAQVSGAGWWATFRRVLLPLIAPALVAGWVYIFVVSFRELSSSILLYTPGNEVLSISIWELYANARFGELSALGVIMVLILAVLVAVAYKVGARVGLKSD